MVTGLFDADRVKSHIPGEEAVALGACHQASLLQNIDSSDSQLAAKSK